MSKNIEADREADRKVIQTRNYNARQFNFSSVEKQKHPVLVIDRDTGVKLTSFLCQKSKIHQAYFCLTVGFLPLCICV